MCSHLRAQPASHNWVGLYRNQENFMPKWIVCVGYFKEFIFGLMQFSVEFMGIFPKSIVGSQYLLLLR